ncbi:MAG: PilZ domain-containing protein [Desulfurivibrionaceae bacterium]|nr:PilZ domain-containing protein [Desulfobulbales bacterium]MDT8335619.1 PilZ domain-containing protein [Desulfurivibrionaceae bacterium]
MTEGKDEQAVERRKHKRFKAKSGTFKAANVEGEIIDISMGGFAFSYLDNGDWADETFDIGMLLGEKDLCIEDVPFKIISDCAINRGLSITRRCGVKFGKLTPKQLSQLEFYIWANTDVAEHEGEVTAD